MRAARAARLRPADEPELLEHLLRDARDLDDLRPLDAGHRIEIDAQLVGAIHVLAAHRVRVEIDAAEVHQLRELRDVVDDDLLGVRPDGNVNVAISIQSGRFAATRF